MFDITTILTVGFTGIIIGYLMRGEVEYAAKDTLRAKNDVLRSKLANLSNETLADIDADDKRYRAMKARVK